jgi:O-antigen biosynthesis protein WbqP
VNRAADLAIALPLAAVAAPIVLVACAWIRLTSPGPAFFVQQRIGRRERIFRCVKLRTMHQGTLSQPTHHVAADAVTDAGRALRQWKIDELPQLWNVLKGEMSLVGPRPCLPTQTELIERRRELGVYSLRPGITGLAQVTGIDMSDPKKCAEADASYLRSRSLALDAAIMWRTLFSRRKSLPR